MSEGKLPPGATRDAVDDALMDRIDRALASWPSPQRSEREWDEAAERIVARATSAALPLRPVEGSDGDLWSAPLAASPDEPAGLGSAPAPVERRGEAITASTARERGHFRELVELARVAPPGTRSEARRSSDGDEWKEDSGIIDLGALAAADRLAHAASPTADAGPRRAGARGWMAIGGFLAGVAAAAAVFAVVRTRSPETAALAPTAATIATGTAAALAAAPENARSSALPEEAAQQVPPSASGKSEDSPLALGWAPEPNGARGLARARSASGATQRRNPGAEATAESASATEAPATASPSAAGATSPNSLENLLRQAAAASAPTVAGDLQARAEQGTVPLKPSLGAIQGALGTALPAARACLGPDDPISRATVTFRSDGGVASVSVSGGAAGTPAEECIRAALMKARVEPFAQPTFTAPATVRPN